MVDDSTTEGNHHCGDAKTVSGNLTADLVGNLVHILVLPEYVTPIKSP